MKPRTLWIGFLTLGGALSLAPAAGIAPDGAATAQKPKDVAATPDSVTPALEKRIRGQAKLDDVRVEIDWSRGSTHTSASIYGNGVGIWNRALQFRLSRAQVIEILIVLQKARFGSMDRQFGTNFRGKKDGSPLRMKGRIVVRVGSLSKSVVQLGDGDQSPEFEATVEQVLEICAGPAKKGTGAASLAEGLQKLAAGQLAPEAFEALVQRRNTRSEAKSPQDSWLLRVEGRTVTNQEMPPGRAPEAPKRLNLSPREYEALIAMLISNDLVSLPENLYTAQYTDLWVEVLGHRQTIVGRRFSGKDREDGSPRRQQFDRIYEWFRDLRGRIEKEGRAEEQEEAREAEEHPKVASPPPPTSPSPEAP